MILSELATSGEGDRNSHGQERQMHGDMKDHPELEVQARASERAPDCGRP